MIDYSPLAAWRCGVKQWRSFSRRDRVASAPIALSACSDDRNVARHSRCSPLDQDCKPSQRHRLKQLGRGSKGKFDCLHRGLLSYSNPSVKRDDAQIRGSYRFGCFPRKQNVRLHVFACDCSGIPGSGRDLEYPVTSTRQTRMIWREVSSGLSGNVWSRRPGSCIVLPS